jgi:hypothetical protein
MKVLNFVSCVKYLYPVTIYEINLTNEYFLRIMNKLDTQPSLIFKLKYPQVFNIELHFILHRVFTLKTQN